MTVVILRRRKLGNTSCKEISNFSKKGIVALRNDFPFPVDTDLVIRWGCTSNVPTKNVVNTAEAIHTVADKTGFRRLLDEKAPHTIPRTIFRFDEYQDQPMVVRPRHHHQGRNLYVVNTMAELRAAVAKCGEGWYASDLIDKVAEYRIAFVQGRAAWVAKKTPGNPDQVAWNVAQGGRFDNVRWGEWPLKAVKVAREAFMVSGLDFGGVDIMVDKDNNVFVLEINSAPSLTSPYRQECFAKCFDYIVENGKNNLPITEARGGYSKFIHPAVCAEAIMVA